MGASHGRASSASACCKGGLATLKDLLLLEFGGEIASLQTAGLRMSTRIDAGLLDDFMMFSHVEAIVFQSKEAPRGQLFRYTCPECGTASALVALGGPFLLAMWRLQMVILGMITESKLTEDGKMVTRWRPPDGSDFDQLNIGCASYFGSRAISEDGVEALLARASKAPPGLIERIKDAVTTAQHWIVAHEAAHFHQDHYDQFSAVGMIRNPRRLARSYLRQQDLSQDERRAWEVELAVDLQATDILVTAICEEVGQRISDPAVVRRSAFSRVAAGACAALFAIDYASICTGAAFGKGTTHPNCAFRWELVAHLLSTRSNLPADSVFDMASVQLLAGQVLFDEWLSSARPEPTARAP